jgi:hypothetical protein
MNLSHTPGKDSTYAGNFLSTQNLSNPQDRILNVTASPKTNSFLIASIITITILLFIFLIYLGWLWYVRDSGEPASLFYSWII